jgi:CRP/FNR family transcriptional regulator, nitrogen fixation regulation protein
MLRLSGPLMGKRTCASETILKFRKGEIIYTQGDPATSWYQVISGTVRTCHLSPDGHRQLTGFHYDGDVFGIDGTDHHSSAEAVSAVILRRWSHGTSGQAEPTDELATPIGMIQSALSNAQACIFLLGRRTATERVAAFLLATARRLGGRGSLRLPMSRSDIADHLGLTIHTVSRTLSEMARRGIIALDGPHAITLSNPAMLQRLAEGMDGDGSAALQTPTRRTAAASGTGGKIPAPAFGG